jgi:SagB-type dehydrogenase family enzyme
VALDPDDAPLFRLFWENSSLNARRAPAFAEQLLAFGRRAAAVPQLLHGAADVPLATPDDALFRTQARRASARRFAARPLSRTQLGRLFSAFAGHADGRRLLPSAGGRFPVEVFALLFSAEGDLDRSVVYYNCDRHSLSVAGACPPFESLADDLGIFRGEGAAPAACFLFTVIPRRTVEKYGERGGRFALIEVGHYAQNLGLRLAEDGLAGYELGGVREEPMRRLLGLGATDAMVALGHAVGHGAG